MFDALGSPRAQAAAKKKLCKHFSFDKKERDAEGWATEHEGGAEKAAAEAADAAAAAAAAAAALAGLSM